VDETDSPTIVGVLIWFVCGAGVGVLVGGCLALTIYPSVWVAVVAALISGALSAKYRVRFWEELFNAKWWWF
jgi:hypothetical protein